MTAPTLFDAPPPVRDSDPVTSHAAAAMPHLPAQRLAVLAVLVALVALGDCTPWHIVERLSGPESGTVRSRLSQLERAGLAVKVGTAPGAKGAANTVWRATPAGRAHVEALGGPTESPP